MDVSGERYVSPVPRVWDRPRPFYGWGGVCVRARTRVHGTTKTRMVRRDDALYTFSPSKGTNRTTPFTSSILGRKGIYYVILFLVRILRGP